VPAPVGTDFKAFPDVGFQGIHRIPPGGNYGMGEGQWVNFFWSIGSASSIMMTGISPWFKYLDFSLKYCYCISTAKV
jgi:hypothetical protein